jgi:hypothetical protein
VKLIRHETISLLPSLIVYLTSGLYSYLILTIFLPHHLDMELTPELAFRALSPTTAYWDPTSGQETLANDMCAVLSPWDGSSLNPKNRIDSLSPLPDPKWRIDGCTSLGTQFFTIPMFLSCIVPLRIDTFLPHPSTWPPELVRSLNINTAFLYRDSRVVRFGISQHILRTLELWSSNYDNFQKFYEELPFGSRIIFENMVEDIRQIRVQIVRTHHLEMQLLSVPALTTRWDSTAPVSLPPKVDISTLQLVRQLQDSTALVKITIQGSPQQAIVFKTLSDSPKYLYHELKVLLSMPSHQNIISRPLHLVTKACRFGGKTGVVGFTLPYHQQGSLRDILPFRHIHQTLYLHDQVKWALQITQALLHIRNYGPGFYCDLRLDNILLSDSDDVLLIDFEQRGVLPAFAAPEDNYFQYINSLANGPSQDASIRKEYQQLFQEHIEPYVPCKKDVHGGCTSWLCFTNAEREVAEIYMLGRLLWCIFNGVSAPQRELWMEYKYDPDIEFPEFRLTPMELRELLEHCTRGWDHGSERLRRSGRQLVINKPSQRCEDNSSSTTLEKLIIWWRNELEQAKLFLRLRQQRTKGREDGHSNHFGRLSLQAILEALQGYQSTV